MRTTGQTLRLGIRGLALIRSRDPRRILAFDTSGAASGLGETGLMFMRRRVEFKLHLAKRKSTCIARSANTRRSPAGTPADVSRVKYS